MADIKVAGKEALQTLWSRVYEEYPRGITKGTSSASGLPIHLRKGYDNNGTWVSTGNTDTVTLTKSDITALGIPGSDTTYSLTGALASHKFTLTQTPSSGSAQTTDLTLAAGSNITLTDDTANRKITIATSAEVNQNAFSNVKVGSTTIAADSKTDTLELVAGSNITLTPDATNDKLTIGATDTTYSDFAGTIHGLVPASDEATTKKLLWSDGSWNELRFSAGYSDGVVPVIRLTKGTSELLDEFEVEVDRALSLEIGASGDYELPYMKIHGQKIWHAVCDTAASTTAKVAVLDTPADYSLAAGVTVAVTFKYGNSATTPTLNIKKNSSDTGSAKTIAYASSATAYTTGEGTGVNSWGAYETVLFTYTGTYWCRTDGRAIGYVKGLVPAAGSAMTADGLSGTSDNGSGGSASTYARSDHSHALNVASSGTPEMDGTASLGNAHTYARTNHVHPTDTSRAPIDSPVFTTKAELASGAIPATSDNSARIPSTSWVQSEIAGAIGTISGNMVYKGTVSAASDLLNIPLKTGWLYVAAAAFTLNGESLQVGDSIIIHTATDPETYTTEADLDAHSDIIQTNTTLLKQSDMTGWFTIPPATPSA